MEAGNVDVYFIFLIVLDVKIDLRNVWKWRDDQPQGSFLYDKNDTRASE